MTDAVKPQQQRSSLSDAMAFYKMPAACRLTNRSCTSKKRDTAMRLRILKKKCRARVLVIPAIFTLGFITLIPAVSGAGETRQAFPENDTTGYVPVEVIVIDPTVKAATPDYNFLVLDDEGKANCLRDLNTGFDLLYAADPKKDAKYAALVAELNAIWDKYPVVSETKPGSAGYPTYGGPETTIRFAPSVTETKLTGDENAAIRESAAIMNEAYQKSHPTQPTPLPAALMIPALTVAGTFIFHRKEVKKRKNPRGS
ncbi:MAG: hypothetical protein PHD55_03095 [Methanoregula sp.]|nr:hypothetical protein [Methanoregula sp.]